MKLGFLLLVGLTWFCVATPVTAQIAQAHPEYCGIPGGMNPTLPDISALLDPLDQHIVLRLGRNDSGTSIPLPEPYINEIAEVCPLSDGRLIVFAKFGGTDVTVVDPAKRAAVDHFLAYDPVSLSPDQRWIAYVKFFALHGVDGSDQLILYDLSGSPEQNRADTAGDDISPGAVAYPPGHENFPGSNINLPTEQRHSFGPHIYWADDGHAMAFEDAGPGGSGIALVALNEKGAASTFFHSLTPAEICGTDVQTRNPNWRWQIAPVVIGADIGGSPSLAIDIAPSGDKNCAQHTLRLQSEDFRPAAGESRPRPKYRRGAMKDGKEIIPPKLK